MKITRENLGQFTEIVKGWLKKKPPRNCFVDGTPLVFIGTDSQGHDMFQCEDPAHHIFSPGVDVGDKDGLIEKSKGTQPGDI